jgi:hypothetical protein
LTGEFQRLFQRDDNFAQRGKFSVKRRGTAQKIIGSQSDREYLVGDRSAPKRTGEQSPPP